jgi:hypothetical protein
LNDANPQFAKIEMPFGIDYFGGWSRAYPDVIEKVYSRPGATKVGQNDECMNDE